MEKEMNRLSTFFNYPSSSNVCPSSLAHSGFYYTGRDCVVKCHCCRITLQNIQSNADMENRHRSSSPNCKYVVKLVENCTDNGISECDVREEENIDLRSDEDRNYTNKCTLSNLVGRRTVYLKEAPFYETIQSVAGREERALKSINMATLCNETKLYNENSPQGGCREKKVRRPDNDLVVGQPFASFAQGLQSMDVSTAESGLQEEEGSAVQNLMQRARYKDTQEHDLSFQDGNALGRVEPRFYWTDTAIYGVRCLLCDGGLKSFQGSDGACRKHARCFLQFAILQKRRSRASVGLHEAQLLPPQAEGVTRSVGNDAAGLRDVTATGSHTPKNNKKNVVATASAISNIEEEIKTLSNEYRKLRETLSCKVCMENKLDTVFLPCRHLSCCGPCAEPLKNCNICGVLVGERILVIT